MLASVTRAGRLLALFTVENPSWGVTEMAAAIGMPKSSTHLLARSLEEIGLPRQGSDRRFRPAVQEWWSEQAGRADDGDRCRGRGLLAQRAGSHPLLEHARGFDVHQAEARHVQVDVRPRSTTRRRVSSSDRMATAERTARRCSRHEGAGPVAMARWCHAAARASKYEF
jgi:hypothetical protein